MLVHSVDGIPRDFSSIQADALDCLLLPLLSAITADSSFRPKPASRLFRTKVSNLFKYCPTSHYWLPKTPSELRPDKTIATRFANSIRTGRATFEPLRYVQQIKLI
ncbi:hypothetical protein [Parasitella parasitica]|uniref:Uncharacterized protein n=1 Tax=Parasitella parasitica TaxID=35722 RepID=A0A0B7MZI8_9FUNG|nr:hypothetical protein [Parasitella parasitica]